VVLGAVEDEVVVEDSVDVEAVVVLDEEVFTHHKRRNMYLKH